MIRFYFTAHVIDTDRVIKLTVTVEDQDEMSWIDMADEAYDIACIRAARRLGADMDKIEVISD